jgi:predicted transcriptional regulator
MKAAEIMRQPVLATTPEAWVQEVLTYLATNNISGMPVAERDSTVIGIVTADDILRAFVDGAQLKTLTVQDIMSQDPITVDVETPLVDMMRILHNEGVLRVPVLENDRLVGIISRSDLIKALVPLEGLEGPGFLAFYHQHHDSPNPERPTPLPAHLVHTHGW